jgi:hypothetical protein
MPARAQHLHTYFLFPFSIDKEAVTEAHAAYWQKGRQWIDGLDEWIAAHPAPFLCWQRSPYTRFDIDSPAYQDMVFFHPVVRRVFFDTTGQTGSREALLRCYTMTPPAGARLWLAASDTKGRGARVEVTDLRLFLFANGVGILSIGIEAWAISVRQALWINEAMRKVYPSSGRQLREGRAPNRISLELEQDGRSTVLAVEHFNGGGIVGFQPPLAQTITSLIYFADYAQQEFEPVLDERMIVYTYLELDPASVPKGYVESEEYQILLSRLLSVEQDGDTYRYETGFQKHMLQERLYRRWAHQGTYYGFTRHSNVTAAIGQFDCDEHQLLEGFLIHRMFATRYYLMALVALFYRATLLDFSERTALVSRRLFQGDGVLTPDRVHMADQLRSDFLQFSNYWHFHELANKEEEIEHFEMQCRQYRIAELKHEIETEVESLDASLQRHYQFRNTEAINRVAVLSLLLGAGAMITGFFGMNFGGFFGQVFFEPTASPVIHYLVITLVALYSVASVAFGAYVVISNWRDYRSILDPRHRRRAASASLRKP